VAPLSYFFCANAAREPESNANADAPPTNPRLLVLKENLPVENGAGVSSGIQKKRRPTAGDLPHYGYVATLGRRICTACAR
jgi:hypothetical protein